MKSFVIIGLFAALTVQGFAQSFVVDAKNNASCDLTGLSTVNLVAGESFSVSADPSQLWSLGDLPRWCNANGLTGNIYATGTDASGQSAGTLIGQSFGNWSQNGESFVYGTLVGQIGSGNFFQIGTSYTGTASSAGTLKLYCWDSYSPDNSGSITARVNTQAVPEPAPVLAFGVGAIGLLVRRRRA